MRRDRSSRILVSIVLVALLASVLLARSASFRGTQPAATPGESILSIAVLDVGQADSIVVRSPAGRTMLVDAGNERKDVEQVVLPYLSRHGISSLDYLVLTHPHQDHVGGMPAVLDSVQVAAFVDSALPGAGNQAYLHTLQRVQSKGIKAIKARRGQTEIDLGTETQVQLLAPEEPLLTDVESFENANSVVLRVQFGAVAALLTGDIEGKTEERLLSHRDDLRSQILKVAHHGSRYASTDQFLDAVRPEVALVSAGAGNSYGHPHRETIDRLERRRIEIFRTDQNGTIEVTTDGRDYRVTVEMQGG